MTHLVGPATADVVATGPRTGPEETGAAPPAFIRTRNVFIGTEE